MSAKYRQPLIIIACGIVLCALVAQLNHELAPWHLNLFAGGLLITYPALRLSHRDLWRIVLPLGLWMDAATPVPFGLHTILFFLACAILYHVRVRLPRADTVLGIVVAVLTNAGISLALSLAFALRGPIPGNILGTLLCDVVLSSAFVALIARWFFALQNRALISPGIDPHAQLTQT